MTKDELMQKAADLYWGMIDIHQFGAAVDLYTKALLQQAHVSGPLTPCDYRNPECSSTGKVVDGAWICSNHRRQ